MIVTCLVLVLFGFPRCDNGESFLCSFTFYSGSGNSLVNNFDGTMS